MPLAPTSLAGSSADRHTGPAAGPRTASLAESLDAITVEQLRGTGALKWGLPERTVGAFVAEMDYGTSPAITAALSSAVARGEFGYPTPALIDRTREVTAERLASAHGWQVAPQDVHPVPDVITVLEKAIALTTDPGTPVVVPTPAYMNFFTAIRAQGREVVEVPMLRDAGGTHRLDLPGIAEAFARTGAQLITLCNPHNPTGRVFTTAELEGFAAVVEQAGARVFADEIWAPVVFSGHRHVPYASLTPRTAAHTLTAVAASKGWNVPGLKCAQAVLTSDVDREAWAGIQPPTANRTAPLGMVGTIAAYQDRSGWIEGVTDYLQDCTRMVADVFAEHLPQVPVTRPEGTYVSWIDLRGVDLPCAPVEHLQAAARLLPTDGLSCGAVGAGHVRLIAAMPRPVLRRALDQMVQALGASAH